MGIPGRKSSKIHKNEEGRARRCRDFNWGRIQSGEWEEGEEANIESSTIFMLFSDFQLTR